MDPIKRSMLQRYKHLTEEIDKIPNPIQSLSVGGVQRMPLRKQELISERLLLMKRIVELDLLELKKL